MLIDSEGRSYAIGHTPADDSMVPSYLFKIRDPQKGEEHLVFYAPPAASAPTVMVVARLVNGKPQRSMEILHRYELSPVEDSSTEPQVSLVDHPTFALSRLVFTQPSDTEADVLRDTFEVGRRALTR